MRLNLMNSDGAQEQNEPHPLPPVDLRRWAGQVETIEDPYDRHRGSRKVGFRGSAENVRSGVHDRED